MDRSLEIEKVLASLSAQGSYQSTGEFALDPVKAAKKLQSRSLFAEYWILRWIQGNVLAGATRIEGRNTRTSVELYSNASPLEREQLESLLNPATALGGSGRLMGHLGASVQAAIGQGPALLEIGSNGGKAVCLEIREGRGELRQGGERAPGNWIRATGLPGLRRHGKLAFLSFIFNPLGPRTNALGRFLYGFCRYSPIPIIWNGTPLNQPLIGESGRLVGSACCFSPNAEIDGAGYFIGENEEPGVFPTFPVTHGRRLMWVKGIQAEPTGWQTLASTGSSFGTVLSRKRPIPEVVSQAKSLPSLWCNDKNMIGCSAAFQIVKGAPTFLTIVADGIGFYIRLGGQKGHRLVVAGNHLSFDLTGFGVIADSKLKATLEFLQEFLGRWDQETR